MLIEMIEPKVYQTVGPRSITKLWPETNDAAQEVRAMIGNGEMCCM